MELANTQFIEITVDNPTFYNIISDVSRLKEYVRSKFENTNYNGHYISQIE